jgi:hypothetical protein
MLRLQDSRCGTIPVLLLLAARPAAPARIAGDAGRGPASSLLTVDAGLNID